MTRGYSAFADVIKTTVDGVDLGHVWAEHQETLKVWNDARDSIASLLTHRTTGRDGLSVFGRQLEVAAGRGRLHDVGRQGGI